MVSAKTAIPQLREQRKRKILLIGFFKAILAFTVCSVWSFGHAPGLPFSACGSAWAKAPSGLTVKALVESDSVSLGEPFMLQIRIEGSDIAPGAEQPDMSGVNDFTVEYLGGRSNNSSSVTIINGKIDKVESYGYVYSYRLTPKMVGKLAIPSIAVPVDAGKSKILRTEPITVRVAEPEVTDDFHLELKFSKTNFYVGEPVILTVVWFLGKDVESVAFNLPILQDDAFSFIDPQTDQAPGKQYFQIRIGEANVSAEKGMVVKDGREFTTLSFRKVLFARQPGTYETPEATVSCKALVGYSRPQQRRSPLDGFFDDDFFNLGKKGVYNTFITRSSPQVLTVLDLPEEGKPVDFSGQVGSFQVESSANPTDVSVGDPITFTVSVSGSEYLDNVEIPPLAKDPEIEKDFKIPEERAAGAIRGGAKEFTQTLRPKSADVKAIPPVKFPYFNPDTGSYEIAQSKPIALTVKPARVLTSADVEGKAEEPAVKKNELENWSQGIAYNYEGPEVMEREVYRISSIVRSPLWLAVILVPFLAFLSLRIFTAARQRRMADPVKLRSKEAFSRFKLKVRAGGAEGTRTRNAGAFLLDAVRTYLGDKLNSNGTALTFADIEGILKERGIDSGLLERLKDLFDACERVSYGGMELSKPYDELVSEAMDLVRSLERVV
ncbi:MAG: BatD family protein [Syntrophobacteraceae bacterium]